MNIFATYPCPVKSATVLDDQRLIKMTLESCQMLSTAAHFAGAWKTGFCKPTHGSHPCNLWAREHRQNFEWLLEHAIAMDAERKRRWGVDHDHKTLAAIIKLKIHRVARELPRGSSIHANCARNVSLGIDFTHMKDVHRAYRKYLAARWLTQARPAICTIKGYFDV